MTNVTDEDRELAREWILSRLTDDRLAARVHELKSFQDDVASLAHIFSQTRRAGIREGMEMAADESEHLAIKLRNKAKDFS